MCQLCQKTPIFHIFLYFFFFIYISKNIHIFGTNGTKKYKKSKKKANFVPNIYKKYIKSQLTGKE